MNNTRHLLSSVQLGPYTLPNRLVMAPLTRNRAGDGNVPVTLNATYYSQRASAGLIISEATQICPEGQGYPYTPGIHNAEQVAGWRLVTDAVHAKGGHIFLQLWHVGRISHPSLQPGGGLPVAPSAIAPEGDASTLSGPQPFVTPRALETAEIPAIVENYRLAAENAMAAGFDGVEIHAANGYLIDQFLEDSTNHRTDRYGGDLENRARFLMEIVEAVTSVWGANKVGVRLSPAGTFNSMSDSNPQALFSYVAEALNPYGLAYLHLIEPRPDENSVSEDSEHSPLTCDYFRSIFKGTIISAGGYNQELAEATIAAGNADLIAFGRLYIANPDLAERFAVNAPLNPYDRSTFYGGDEKGYTDYPTLQLEKV
ncbi:alkene reductase [Ancylothrix sp. C2]|uniref:alkene reductase n=1 Tax=Ancylothrix sp. D3o TaxID=2953691 RepID=UPI0021BB3608|nr:alkene reductase [Ancylothrix sp. D3o]MCT7952656.1 alkene reductase [Ancylothrix sp. D3o]